jgi:hypothetical protein
MAALLPILVEGAPGRRIFLVLSGIAIIGSKAAAPNN